MTRKEGIDLLERKRQRRRSSLRYTYTPAIEGGILVIFGEVPISTTIRASTLPAYWYARRLPKSLGSTFYLRNDSRSQEGNKLVRYIPCNENITYFGVCVIWWILHFVYLRLQMGLVLVDLSLAPIRCYILWPVRAIKNANFPRVK